MAHRGVCPDMACQRVAIELERQASERRACQVVADELGIPVKTVLTWIYRNKMTSNEVKKGQDNHIEKETPTITNLHTIQIESIRKKILLGLRETDGKRFLVMQEYRIGRKGVDTPTKNRFTIPIDLITQFRSVLDQVEVLIRGRCLAESGADGSNPGEGDEEESPATDEAEDTDGIEVDGIGGQTESSPMPTDSAEDIKIEAPQVRCLECNHFAVKKWAPEENGACNSRSGSWNGNVFQPPNEPHHCQNFSPGGHKAE